MEWFEPKFDDIFFRFFRPVLGFFFYLGRGEGVLSGSACAATWRSSRTAGAASDGIDLGSLTRPAETVDR